MTRLDNTRYSGTATLPINTNQFFNTNWDYEATPGREPGVVDPKFGQPNQWLAPREVRLTVKFKF